MAHLTRSKGKASASGSSSNLPAKQHDNDAGMLIDERERLTTRSFRGHQKPSQNYNNDSESSSSEFEFSNDTIDSDENNRSKNEKASKVVATTTPRLVTAISRLATLVTPNPFVLIDENIANGVNRTVRPATAFLTVHKINANFIVNVAVETTATTPLSARNALSMKEETSLPMNAVSNSDTKIVRTLTMTMNHLQKRNLRIL
ncbi:hypothetical protein BGW42_006937 [Actinomortierella wolfii]|nr:hypothetical protein BGW42_006937 [Actinomortierella wolfii]